MFVEDLMNSGFGYMSLLGHDLFVRITKIEPSRRQGSPRYLFEIIQPTSALRRTKNGGNKRTILKWWKNDFLRNFVKTAVTQHIKFSLDVEQRFTLNAESKLVLRSQVKLRKFS